MADHEGEVHLRPSKTFMKRADDLLAENEPAVVSVLREKLLKTPSIRYDKDAVGRVMEALFEECRSLRKAGQKEYAHQDDNPFRNFETLAAELNLSREKALWVYFRKHTDGILAYINGHKSQRESVRGRIKDSIVYLVLLAAMIEEEESNAIHATLT